MEKHMVSMVSKKYWYVDGSSVKYLRVYAVEVAANAHMVHASNRPDVVDMIWAIKYKHNHNLLLPTKW